MFDFFRKKFDEWWNGGKQDDDERPPDGQQQQNGDENRNPRAESRMLTRSEKRKLANQEPQGHRGTAKTPAQRKAESAAKRARRLSGQRDDNDEDEHREEEMDMEEAVEALEWIDIDRSKDPELTSALLAEERVKVEKEVDVFGDYYPLFKENAREDLKELAKVFTEPFTDELAKRIFWDVEMGQEERSHRTHASLECARSFGEGKKGPQTVSQAASIIRFIRIKALCEPCYNPFGLAPEELVGKTCTCQGPLEPKFKPIPASLPVPAGKTEEQVKDELWEKQMKESYVYSKEGMKEKLKKELGVKTFVRRYPKHNVELCNRTDEFGQAVWRRQQELHALRKRDRLPPIFLFAWTSKETGGANLPEEWVADGDVQLSTGAQKVVERLKEKKNGKLTHVRCSCKENCAADSKKECCADMMRWHQNKNGVISMKNGLLPAGTDGKDCARQPHEMEDVAVTVCSKNCKCDLAKCASRFVERGSDKIRIIFDTPDKGWSVRTAELLVRGEYMLSFSGIIMSEDELKPNSINMEMVYAISALEGDKAKEEDLLTHTSDARSNEFRCVNHSCAPNSLVVSTFSSEWGNAAHGITIVARRDINPFEECTIDYYAAGLRFRFACLCGAYCCRGIMGTD